MEDINEQLKQLYRKIIAVNSIESLKNFRNEFIDVCFAFADLHKKLERGLEFDWYKRFRPVIDVLDKELEKGNLENARSSFLSNIEAMQSFKKNANELMQYQSFNNENKEVDRKEKLDLLKKNYNLDKFTMSSVFQMLSQVSELNNILADLSPPDIYKHEYDATRLCIKANLEILLEGASKWNKAKRPTEIAILDFKRVKQDLHGDLQKCIRLLESAIG